VVLLTELVERVATLEAETDSLKERQEKQNGNLERLEAKIDRIQQWLVGLLGSVIVSLVLLLVNMSLGR